MHVERWKCVVCNLPCFVEIHATDTKLPPHLRGLERFDNRACPCNETRPVWQRVFDFVPCSVSVDSPA